eukprot:gnl/MRDRNA2_/MRDRNA2_104802_c0_seq1.p1 gnl/MRDRNA2_/MRDRNA2_104802_c0~~gnl/MRDRNA2_/MRDRNA2_104802_c0_seq1.p1  ORF type:complete len:355 (-),score=67.84 gnl/MRDRNA2_/MRDRNA2_104802_c0_seq1:32-1096(-)
MLQLWRVWNLRLLMLLGVTSSVSGDCPSFGDDDSNVFKSASWVKQQIDNGRVSLLDARGDFSTHLNSAVHAPWPSFTGEEKQGTPEASILKSISELKSLLAGLGVTPAKTVVVYGNWAESWGEEGRIHWMLKYLGHPNAFILQGGFKAYSKVFAEEVTSEISTPKAVDISEWESGYEPMMEAAAEKEDLSGALLIDVRTQGEYDGTKVDHDGKPMYGVARLGHAEGAVSFPFSELFTTAGCLIPCSDFESKLSALGWNRNMKLVSYCTGGIRSAFFWSTASHCGLYAIANYAGSMWEYAADESQPMTLSNSLRDKNDKAAENASSALSLKIALRCQIMILILLGSFHWPLRSIF